MPPTPLLRWLGFHAVLLLLLAAEYAFSRYRLPRQPGPVRAARQHRNAIAATVMWVATALLFAVYVDRTLGHPAATQFLAGYSLEQALSVDNLFVFLLLFKIFGILPAYQPRVLFWGVAGAIVMRGAFIAAGLGLLTRFSWISYAFAVLLLVASIRLLIPEQPETADQPPQKPLWIRWISRIHPVSPRADIFFTTENGHRVVTLLFISLLAIEVTDVVFALDSIPAVLSITRNPFLAYTSNIMAVMGLRSLFLLLASMLSKLRYLHFGLAAVLAFAALKMLLARKLEVGPIASLAVIAALLAITILASLLASRSSATKPHPPQASS